MKRSSFAWALALVAIVFGLFALTPAPTLALDTGPQLESLFDIDANLLQLVSLTADQSITVAQVASTRAYNDTSVALAIVAERIEDADHPDTVRLWRDPGNSVDQLTHFQTHTDSLAKPPDHT